MFFAFFDWRLNIFPCKSEERSFVKISPQQYTFSSLLPKAEIIKSNY